MKFLKTKIKHFNDWLADRLSYVLSIMVTFYVISILVTIPLFYTRPTSVVAWASYLCSVVFQGIALPVLGYTSRKASDKSDALMKEMYEMTRRIEKIVNLIEKEQQHIDSDLDKIIDLENKK